MLELLARPLFQRICVDPVARLMAKKKLTNQPFMVTLLAGVFGLLVCALLWLQHPYPAILCLLLSGYADILDGTLARFQQRQNNLGAVLDIMMDRVVEILVIFGLFLFLQGQYGWIFMLMLASSLICITSFLVVGIFSENNSHKSFHYSPGLMERAEAFIFFIAIMLMPQYVVWLGLLYSLLVFYTAGRRLFDFYQQLHEC